MLWLTYTLVPVCALALLIFIWNMILAPYRIEKDARLESDGISKDKIELLSEKNLHLQSTVDASNSPKGKIRSILASINPSILNDVDNGNDRIYIVATVAKFQALVDACDNPKGRQLCAKIAEHGQDSGSNSRMGGGGEPHRDSSDIGWKTHFTLYPLPALIERVR